MNGPGADPQLLLALLAAAVLEEIVFRAGIQDLLLRWSRRHGGGPRRASCSAANLVTALLFAAAHGLARSWPLAAAALPAALALGWLYERTQRLWPCMLLHAVMNIAWLAAVQFRPEIATLLG